MILNNLLIKQNALTYIKQCLIDSGYIKYIAYLNGQIDLINEIFDKESFCELDMLLRLKTNYRLLVRIDKGQHNIVDIINNPNDWQLAKVSDNCSEWQNQDALIFSTEKHQLVFSKNDLQSSHKYITNKWQ